MILEMSIGMRERRMIGKKNLLIDKVKNLKLKLKFYSTRLSLRMSQGTKKKGSQSDRYFLHFLFIPAHS